MKSEYSVLEWIAHLLSQHEGTTTSLDGDHKSAELFVKFADGTEWLVKAKKE